MPKFFDQKFGIAKGKLPLALPFFHSCDAIYLEAIIQAGCLQTQFCKVYNELLLYLFYGKPGYKSSEDLNSRLDFMAPVVFIINYDAISSIYRLMPFDSGGWPYYKDCMHKSMQMGDFELSPSKQSLIKTLHFFWGNNKKYLIGEGKPTIKYDRSYSPLEMYHNLITGNHKTERDDRKACLEVQLNYNIPLNKHTIEAIILPENLNKSDAPRLFFRAAQIPTISYPNYGVKSDNYYVHIQELVRAFYKKKRLI